MNENLLYERTSHPVMIVISGPSAVGKDTIARSLIERQPDRFFFVVTATNREPREGETHGVDYMFVTTAEFARMIDEDELLEYAVVYDDYKGVPKQQIRDALASNRDVIMRVDVQGAATIRKKLPNAIFIFLTAESEESMVSRLISRRTETDESLHIRIAAARKEMRRIDEFNYWVINPDQNPDQAVDEIMAIITAAHCQIDRAPVEL